MAQPKAKSTIKVQKAVVQVLGDGVVVRREGSKLLIEIDTSKNVGMSASGKNLVIATTRGNQVVEIGDGKTAVLGVNLYTRPA